MLQALRGSIAGAGAKIGDQNKKALIATLLSQLDSNEVIIIRRLVINQNMI